MPAGSARSVPTHGTSLPAVSLNPVSLLWPPSSSVLEGVTNTSRKVTPRSHLQLAASPPGPTPHTHRVSSRDQRPAQAQRRSSEGNSPTGESKERGRPSGPDTGGPTEEAWVGQSQSPLHQKGWWEGRAFLPFYFPGLSPAQTPSVSPRCLSGFLILQPGFTFSFWPNQRHREIK